MFKDFAAGVDIQLSGKRFQVLMAYTHPGVPSSLGPELVAGAWPHFNKENLQKALASGLLSVPRLPAPRPSLHSCYSSSTPPPYTLKFAHLGMAPLG